jgi:5-methylcytosine-specific restriction endonuclease McrA
MRRKPTKPEHIDETDWWFHKEEVATLFRKAAGRSCAMCRMKKKAPTSRITAHHVVAKTYMKDHIDPWELGLAYLDIIWDPANAMGLCFDCHLSHEAGGTRIPRELLKPWHWRFAASHGWESYLEIHYQPAGQLRIL